MGQDIKIWTIYTYQLQSNMALRTPRYNRLPDKTDSNQFPGENKLQTFDWNKLPLLRTLAN